VLQRVGRTGDIEVGAIHELPLPQWTRFRPLHPLTNQIKLRIIRQAQRS
jgi:hypothetical protein